MAKGRLTNVQPSARAGITPRLSCLVLGDLTKWTMLAHRKIDYTLSFVVFSLRNCLVFQPSHISSYSPILRKISTKLLLSAWYCFLNDTYIWFRTRCLCLCQGTLESYRKLAILFRHQKATCSTEPDRSVIKKVLLILSSREHNFDLSTWWCSYFIKRISYKVMSRVAVSQMLITNYYGPQC